MGDARARLIWAKYSGICRTCGNVIGEGEHIYYDGKDDDGVRVWHEDCLADGRLGPED